MWAGCGVAHLHDGQPLETSLLNEGLFVFFINIEVFQPTWKACPKKYTQNSSVEKEAEYHWQRQEGSRLPRGCSHFIVGLVLVGLHALREAALELVLLVPAAPPPPVPGARPPSLPATQPVPLQRPEGGVGGAVKYCPRTGASSAQSLLSQDSLRRICFTFKKCSELAKANN